MITNIVNGSQVTNFPYLTIIATGSSDSKSVTEDYSSEGPEDSASIFIPDLNKCPTNCYPDGSVYVVNCTTSDAIPIEESKKSSYATVQLKEISPGESVLSICLPPGCSRVELVYDEKLPEVTTRAYDDTSQQHTILVRGKKTGKRSRKRVPFHPKEKSFILDRFDHYRNKSPHLHIKDITRAIWHDLQNRTFEDEPMLNEDEPKRSSKRTAKSICTLLYNQRALQ